MSIRKLVGISAAVALSLAVFGGTVRAAEEPKGDAYTLSTCPISGKPLGDTPVVKTIEGRELRFCCGGCPAKAEADPAGVFAKVDEQMIAAQKADYPVTECLVMEGDKLIEGETTDIVYKNRLVRFCCDDCIKDFKADPAKFMAMLDKAVIEKQKPAYSAKTCPVSGKELGEGAIDYVVANKLVRLCCGGCKAKVDADPAKYLPKAGGESATPASRAEEKRS